MVMGIEAPLLLVVFVCVCVRVCICVYVCVSEMHVHRFLCLPYRFI